MPKTQYERNKEYIKNNDLVRIYATTKRDKKFRFELKLAKQKKVTYKNANDFFNKKIDEFIA